jgi:hypothetical protein
MFTLVVWGIALGLAPPNFLTVTVHSWHLCVSSDDECMRTVQFSCLYSVFLFIIPLLNLKTTWHLGDTIHRMPGEKQLIVQDNSRKRVANMVVVITTMFSVHYIPNFRLSFLHMGSARTCFRIYVSCELCFILLVLLTVIFQPNVRLYYAAASCCTVYSELALSLLTVPVKLH